MKNKEKVIQWLKREGWVKADLTSDFEKNKNGLAYGNRGKFNYSTKSFGVGTRIVVIEKYLCAFGTVGKDGYKVDESKPFIIAE